MLEGWSTLGNIKTMAKRRGQTPFFRYLRETKDSDLIVVFGENSAAVLGLVLALAAVGLSKVTNDGRWDAIGSLASARAETPADWATKHVSELVELYRQLHQQPELSSQEEKTAARLAS